MKFRENDIKDIERYLDRNMTPDESKNFEQRLSQESDLALEYTTHKNAITELKRREKLKVELRGIFDEVRQKKEAQTSKPRYSRLYLAMAAVVSLFIAVWALFLNTDRSNYSELYDEFYTPLPVNGVNRGDIDNNNESNLTQALLLYQNKEYEQALVKLEDLTKDKDAPPKLWVYIANCHMNTGDLVKAEEAILIAETNGGNFTRQYAEWYRALVYLKENDITATKNLLQKIDEDGGIYQKDAQRLLEELN